MPKSAWFLYQLKRRERILALRGNGLTLEQIGKKMNLTKQRVSQIIKKGRIT